MLYLGSDHGGFSLKTSLCSALKSINISFEDLGTFSKDSCDYPIFAEKVALKVQMDSHHRGILICTSGIGMAITANKFKAIYAAEITTIEAIEKARQHNGINVLCLPGNLDHQTALKLVMIFLNTNQDTDERHTRRRREINDIELKNFIEKKI